MKNKPLIPLAFIILHSAFSLCARGQGTAFTYQGRLNDRASPANGVYDLRFTIYDSTNSPGTIVAGPLTNAATSVSNGLFTVNLDFGGGIFTGADRWIEIGVTTNGSGTFATLAPRQRLTSTPYAITAGNITGPLPPAGLGGVYPNAVTLNNPSNQFSGTFAGNGGALSNVSAATLGGLSAGQFWKAAGNAGTTGTNFLGTTDNQPLELRVNGGRALRLEPNTNGAPNVIGGSQANQVDAGVIGATISGGGVINYFGLAYLYPNRASADFAAISGGIGNLAQGPGSSIGGGLGNLIESNSFDAAIAGGYANVIQSGATGSTIGGGFFNTNSSPYSLIGGGLRNSVQAGGVYAVLAGGLRNTIEAYANGSLIAGGWSNVVKDGVYAANIGGGEANTNASSYSVIAGGSNNRLEPFSDLSTISGGQRNLIKAGAHGSLIAGGLDNLITDGVVFASTGGGEANTNGSSRSVVGGGSNNRLEPFTDLSVIGGGWYNYVQSGADQSVIAGGNSGRILSGARESFIGGGYANTIQTNAAFSFIGAGTGNTIGSDSLWGTITAGRDNLVQSNASYVTVGGGFGNTVQKNAQYTTIPGGFSNSAAGAYSFAAGNRAKALHDGAFVWADSFATNFSSTASNQFLIRASGGVGIGTTNPTTALEVAGTIKASSFMDTGSGFSGNGGGLTNVMVDSLVVTTKTNHTLVIWGGYSSSQFDSPGYTTAPVGATDVTAVAAGVVHSLALKRDGTVVVWAAETYVDHGQTNVPPGLNNVTAVAAGAAHNLALKNDGTVVAWGWNNENQTTVPAGLNNVAAIAAGAYHSLALQNNGTVVAWGYNGNGQTTVPPGLNNVVAVAAGGFHSLALKSDGAVVAWGKNDAGQASVPAGLSNVRAVAAGDSHSLALKNDGAVVAWGLNNENQTNVPAGLNNVAAVAAGAFHSLALKSNATVVAWGSNSRGQTDVPIGLNNVIALAPSCSAYYALAIRELPHSPAWLDADNTLNGNNTFYGLLQIAGNASLGGMLIGRVGINTTPEQVLHLKVPPGLGEGMEIEGADFGHNPAIYLNHTGTEGRKFRIASYGDNSSPGSFVIRDDTAGEDRFTIDANGSLSGNGAGLTGLNAAGLSSGTLDDARLSANVALRAGGNTFSGGQTFNGQIRLDSADGFSQSSMGNFSIDAPFIPGGRFTVLTDGRVGIGVLTPQQQLSVAAGMNIDQSDANTGTVANTLRFGSASDSAIGSKRSAGGNQFGLDFYTGSANRLSISNNGNVAITSPGSLFFGAQTRQMLNLFGAGYGIGVQDFTMYFRTDPTGGFSWFKGGVHSNTQNSPGTDGTEMMRLDAAGSLNVRNTVTANSLILTSDRNAKENFVPVDARAVLDKVAALPVSEWNFKSNTGTRHIGPMAQDFYAAFRVGEDDKHIAVVDEGGVALAAIQGLNQKLEEMVKAKEARIELLEKSMAELKEIVQNMARQQNGGTR